MGGLGSGGEGGAAFCFHPASRDKPDEDGSVGMEDDSKEVEGVNEEVQRLLRGWCVKAAAREHPLSGHAAASRPRMSLDLEGAGGACSSRLLARGADGVDHLNGLVDGPGPARQGVSSDLGAEPMEHHLAHAARQAVASRDGNGRDREQVQERYVDSEPAANRSGIEAKLTGGDQAANYTRDDSNDGGGGTSETDAFARVEYLGPCPPWALKGSQDSDTVLDDAQAAGRYDGRYDNYDAAQRALLAQVCNYRLIAGRSSDSLLAWRRMHAALVHHMD